MFDDLKKQPDDIFAETEKAENVPPPFRTPQSDPGPSVPPTVMPAINIAPLPTSTPSVESKKFNWKLVVILVIAVVLVVLVGLLASKFIMSSQETAPTEGLPNVSNAVKEKVEIPVVEEQPVVEEEPVIVEEPEIDTDKDGLSDAREAEIGTSPTSVDTDDDGLFDLEEVETYKTNPLSPDTDGDTFKDGDEVKNGYNPNGAGKLFELPGVE